MNNQNYHPARKMFRACNLAVSLLAIIILLEASTNLQKPKSPYLQSANMHSLTQNFGLTILVILLIWTILMSWLTKPDTKPQTLQGYATATTIASIPLYFTVFITNTPTYLLPLTIYLASAVWLTYKTGKN